MNKFKKVLSLIFALFVSVSFFAGCNLIKTNSDKYYSQVVAEVVYKNNETKKFTMKDLLNAYQSYGSNLTNQGSSVEDAVKQTLDSMIDRFLLVEKLKETMPLSEAKMEDLKRETYSNINSTLASYETQIRKDWKLEIEENTDETSEEETTSLRTAFVPYEPTFQNIDGVLKRIKEEVAEEKIIAGEFRQNITDENVSKEAMKRYVSDLNAQFKTEGKQKLNQQDAVKSEVDRIFSLLQENALITKFQEEFVYDLSIDTEAVVNRYKETFMSDYALYSQDISAYHTAMRGQNSSKVVYHPISNQYLNVTHILVKMSEEQNAQIAKIKSDYANNIISKSDYDYKLNQIKENTIITYEDANKNKLTKTINDLKLEIEYLLPNTFSEVQFTSRAKTFNDLIYTYNDDDGIFNNDNGYIVNITDVDGVSNHMNKEFTDASRELSKKQKGSVSDPVFVEYDTSNKMYGFHIIMNLGVVENKVVNDVRNVGNVTWQALMNVYTQPGYAELENGKTLFHAIYDELKLDENRINVRIEELVSEEKTEVKEIKKHISVYKKLWANS